jgi:hypothetical protein
VTGRPTWPTTSPAGSEIRPSGPPGATFGEHPRVTQGEGHSAGGLGDENVKKVSPVPAQGRVSARWGIRS